MEGRETFECMMNFGGALAEQVIHTIEQLFLKLGVLAPLLVKHRRREVDDEGWLDERHLDRQEAIVKRDQLGNLELVDPVDATLAEQVIRVPLALIHGVATKELYARSTGRLINGPVFTAADDVAYAYSHRRGEGGQPPKAVQIDDGVAHDSRV